jgi:hypothetical protein
MKATTPTCWIHHARTLAIPVRNFCIDGARHHLQFLHAAAATIGIVAIALSMAGPASAQAHTKKWAAELKGIKAEISIAEKANIDPLEIAELWLKVGEHHYHGQGTLRNSRINFKKALKGYDDAGVTGTLEYANILVAVGKTYMMTAKDKANDYFIRALPIMEANIPADHEIMRKMEQWLKYVNNEDGSFYPWDENCGPRPIERKMHLYPRTAKERRVEANVIVQFTVDEEGKTTDITTIDVTLSEGRVAQQFKRRFVKSAEKAVAGYTYEKTVIDGIPSKVTDLRIRLLYRMMN